MMAKYAIITLIFLISITITDGSAGARITGVCLEENCANIQNKNAVKNLFATYYPKYWLSNKVEYCKDHPSYYDLENVSQCTESTLKSQIEEKCKEYPEDYGVISADDCKWDNITIAKSNKESEELYEGAKSANWIIFFYFYDLDGNVLTTYECDDPVGSKQEALSIIENGGFGDGDNYCRSMLYTKQGT